MVTRDSVADAVRDPVGTDDLSLLAWLEYTSATRELVDAALTVADHHKGNTLTREHLDALLDADRRRVAAGLRYMST